MSDGTSDGTSDATRDRSGAAAPNAGRASGDVAGRAAARALPGRLRVAPEVADALASGRPVVALESTLISHGLPYPENLEVARASEAAVRLGGAVPATIALHGGQVLVGLDAAQLEHLATLPDGAVRKVSRAGLAAVLWGGGWGATTVSATLLGAHAAGIRVMATGGIGGVHHDALLGRAGNRPSFDISADLEELAATPLAVVCAGPKAILDVPATLEYLETRGVPVVAVGQDTVPGFYARSSGIPAPGRVADLRAAAGVAGVHLALGLGRAILVCLPVPEAHALPEDEVRTVVGRAVHEADAAGISGPGLTPWLLSRIAVLTDGRSVAANRALIINDARAAGELAAALATQAGPAPGL